jgi:hypothetical protein
VGSRLNALVEKIRVARGPFFLARVGLRLRFPLTRADLPDDEERLRELVAACRELGYDPGETPPETGDAG